MGYSARLAWETLRSIDSATLDGTYQRLGGPLLNPSFICKMVNNSNVLVTVSINGTTDIDVAPANSYWVYDESKYGIPSIQFLQSGTQFFVKGAAGAENAGLIYLVTQYIVAP